MQICDVSYCRSRRGNYVPINALTAVGALRALMILLVNGEPLAVKGLTASKTVSIKLSL